MRTIDPARSTLLIIDMQQRLVPAIDGHETVVANCRRLLDAGRMLGVPAVATEQYPRGLGPTIGPLRIEPANVLDKTEFDATRNPGFFRLLPGERPDLILVGCEAHVCVLQTALGCLDGKRKIHVVADAIGSRASDNKAAGIDRMRLHGAEIVTTEMVIFEWLGGKDNPRFKEVTALIR